MTDHLIDFFAEDSSRKAAVPGLGVFFTEKNAGGRYRILFEEVAPKGKDFINHVAFRMNVTEAEAVAALDEWVQSLLKSLKTIKVATLPGIGTFEVSDNRVQFLPSAEQNYQDRFGLEKTEAPVGKPTDEDELDDEEDEDEEETPLDKASAKKRRNTIIWTCVGVVIVGGIVALLWLIKPFELLGQADENKIDEIILGNPVENGMMPEEEPAPVAEMPQAPAPSMNVDDEIEAAIEAEEREKKATKAAKEPVAKSVEKPAPATKPAPAPAPKVEKSVAKPAEKPAPKIEPVAKPAPAPKPAANPAPKPAAPKAPAPKSAAAPLEKGVSRPVLGRFYIVVGSFSNLDNARTRYNELASTSAFDMRILFDAEKNIYKVSVKEFNDKNTAIQFKKGLLDNGFDGWIYEHK